MSILTHIDRKTRRFKRFLVEFNAPSPDTLGYPVFSARIAERRQRWIVEKQPNVYSSISSKVDGSKYMQSLGYQVPEVYGVYPSIDEIPQLDELPDNVVLKPLHAFSAAGVFLMKDGISLFDKRRLSRDEIIRSAKSFKGTGSRGVSGPYVAEELLTNFDDHQGAPIDHKFFCFGSKVVAMHITERNSARQADENFHWFYAPEWRQLPRRLKWTYYPERSEPPKPPFYDDMLNIASDVGGRLNIFLRIDMYATKRGPVFGEFTAYPYAGRGFTAWGDAWLGSHWVTRDGGDREAAV